MAKKNSASKTTNERPVSLTPVGFEDALRGLLSIPPSEEPKAEEKAQEKKRKSQKHKGES